MIFFMNVEGHVIYLKIIYYLQKKKNRENLYYRTLRYFGRY